jgi:hypothetical protein
MRPSLISRRVFVLSGTLVPGFSLLADDEAFPFVQVDKPLFAQGEVIRFWVGVSSSGSIPEEKQKPGVLHIIHPDGVLESQPISWPRDGTGDSSWRGGALLGKLPAKLGRYRVSFEWDRKLSPESELTVCELDLLGRLVTRWTFEGKDFQSAAAVLTVENMTNQIVRFCRLGTLDSVVWLHGNQDGPKPLRESILYPQYLLSEGYNQYIDNPRWKEFNQLPLVKVEPHNRFSQALYLSKANFRFPFTTPTIDISTELTLFIGEASDAGSGLYPVRQNVAASRRF